ncbi:unnamed protein product, partial [Arabidopsis halleri]
MNSLMNIRCRGCTRRFCTLCDEEPHFPCTCEERSWWVNRHLVTDPDAVVMIEATNRDHAEWDTLLPRIAITKQELQEGGFAAIDAQLAHVVGLCIRDIDQLMDVLKWTLVMGCVHPHSIAGYPSAVLGLVTSLKNLVAFLPHTDDVPDPQWTYQ